MRIETTVGQVAMVAGDRIDQPPGVLVQEPTSRFARGRNRGSLYTLIELSGRDAGRDSLVSQLTWIVRDVYYNQRGSVTAGLQKAVRGVNGLLFDENRNSLPGERRTAGITCAVLRDNDLFIAQGGPAAAFLAQNGQLTRFPDLSPWLDDLPPEETDAASLGDRRDVQVDLFHAQISPGDVVLLVSPGLVRSLAPQAWPALLAEPSVEEILEGVIASGRGTDLSALVIRLVAEEEPLTVEGSAPEAAQPLGASSVAEPLREPVRAKVSRWLEPLQLGERLRTAGRALAAALAGLWAALFTLLKRMMPERAGPQTTEQRQTRIVTTSGAKPKARRPESPAGRDLVQKVLIVVAVAIPIVVAGLVLFVVAQRGHTRRVELDTLSANATRSWQQAQAASDPADIRTYLVEADGYLKQLLAIRPDDANAVELEKRVQSRLDEVNQVRRINWVAELKSYPSDADLTRIVVEGAHVFVMDRNAGKVYHHQLDDFEQSLKPETSDTVLVSKGQQVGGVLVADLVDMVWVPVGEGRQKASLDILESGGNLLEYDPTTGELKPLRVAESDKWQYPSLVGSYYGRFYVLDSTANKIWRYQPTLDGYSEPPDEWLKTEVDLLGVVDMAIGNSIYLLYTDGRILKFTAGEPDTFDISDWDTPPRNPSALFTQPPEDTQWVYVADRGNSRIVQIGKDGRFRRQFRLADSETSKGQDALSAVTSLFVDEISAHAFFLSGGALYISVLPE